MSQLVDQVQQAGLTVNQYLKTKNLTLEQYQENLKKQVKNEWITNLAIDSIARDQKLTVSEEEVKTLVAKNQQLASNLNLVYYLLTQQKVFDYLKKL
jgi:FKBP-type peptidyl-prolyl cis-trans isomerase (trigger factor)